jgi:hypothetical protein
MADIYQFPGLPEPCAPAQMVCAACESFGWNVYEDGTIACSQCNEEPGFFAIFD